MVIDTSAIVAILLGESDKSYYIDKIIHAQRRLMSASSYVELGIVLRGKIDFPILPLLRKYLISSKIHLVPTDERLAEAAIEAYARYGKGIHPAALNFGDCFAYALALSVDAPLLFKGRDFDKTDVKVA